MDARVLLSGLPPPSFTATPVSGTEIDLRWYSVPGATEYYIAEWANDSWTVIGGEGSNTTSVAVDGLSPGTGYYFDVGAFNAAGGTWGSPQGVTTPTSTPGAPSFTATAVSGTEIDLTWYSVPGATEYYIAEWVNGNWTVIGGEGSGTTSVAVNNLSPNTTYYFDVGAYNAAGGSWGSPQGATTPASTPGAPTFTATAVSGTEIDLAWNSVPGATEYYIAEFVNGNWTVIGGEGSGTTSVAINNLSPNTTYYFDVGAYNAAGGSWGNPQGATTLANAPGAPTFTATAVSGTEIDLAWNSVPGATEYYIAEFVNGSWTVIGSEGSDTTSVAINNLSPNTTYYFDVGAYNAAGGNWGSPQGATTAPSTTGPGPNPNASINPNWSGYVAETNIYQPQPYSVTVRQRHLGRSDGNRSIDRRGLWFGLGGHRRIWQLDRGADRHRGGFCQRESRLRCLVGNVLGRGSTAGAGHPEHDGQSGRFDNRLGRIYHQRRLCGSILLVDRRQQPAERCIQHLCKLCPVPESPGTAKLRRMDRRSHYRRRQHRDITKFRLRHFHQRHSGDQRSLWPDQFCFLAVGSTEHRLEWGLLRYDLVADRFRNKLRGDLQPVF